MLWFVKGKDLPSLMLYVCDYLRTPINQEQKE
jgi:hypothetical protein